jgi:hypothetical protein
VLAHSQHPGRARPATIVAPTVAVATAHTPPPAAADQRSAAEKRELAFLLRSPMRDPFAPASSGG